MKQDPNDQSVANHDDAPLAGGARPVEAVPRTGVAARQECTKDAPMPKGAPGRWLHDGNEIACEDGWPGGDIVTYRCPNCGHEWTEELPQ